jgi:hypothetical protein
MRRVAVLLAVTGALLAFAASGLAKSSGSNARVVGVIRLCGGPAPGRCFNQDGVVSVRASHLKLIASQHTKRAAFAFSLPPGHYTLEATTGGTRSRRLPVDARAHTTIKVNVVIPIP